MSKDNIIIKKASGEEEEFSKDKFCTSLRASGAPEDLVEKVCEAVSRDIAPGMSTNEIFRKASQHLAREHSNFASKYNLKHGMASLGPAGFFFEQFVEAMMGSLGYKTQRNLIMQGKCIEHEVDVVAEKGTEHFLIEAKYRNQAWIKTHVDVVMYAAARLEDVAYVENKREGGENVHKMWVVTNTKFTSSAKKYAKCKGLKLTGWSYPHGEGLEKIISDYALYPVTVLPSVDKNSLTVFAEKNMMLARDLAPHSKDDLVQDFGIPAGQAENIISEAHALVYGEEK